MLVNGTPYTGTTSSSTTVTGEIPYIVTGYDKANNVTGITFTIDKTKPTIAGATS